MSKIVITESLGISDKELQERIAPFVKEGHTFEMYEKSTDDEILKTELADADVLILANMPMHDEVIAAGKNLKFIDVAFTGVDHVGLKAAKQNGIVVSNASGYSNEAVSELVIGMTLALYRKLKETEDRARNSGTKDGLTGMEIKGKTAGIIGLGKIGTRSAQLFHAMGAEVTAYSRTVHADAPSYILQTSLQEVLTKSDIVVLHCPLTDETRHLINRDTIALMKENAVLINVARGPVVNAQDLADALNEGRIAGAGIDVFDAEPPLYEGEPLLQAKNCILTPHIGFATKEAMTLRAEIVFDNLRAWLDGTPKNVVLK